jgi:hypothetical protein
LFTSSLPHLCCTLLLQPLIHPLPPDVTLTKKIEWFGNQLQTLQKRSYSVSKLKIRREKLLEDTIKAIKSHSIDDFRTKRIEVNFKGELGYDMGGLTKEWFDKVKIAFFFLSFLFFVLCSCSYYSLPVLVLLSDSRLLISFSTFVCLNRWQLRWLQESLKATFSSILLETTISFSLLPSQTRSPITNSPSGYWVE